MVNIILKKKKKNNHPKKEIKSFVMRNSVSLLTLVFIWEQKQVWDDLIFCYSHTTRRIGISTAIENNETFRNYF